MELPVGSSIGPSDGSSLTHSLGIHGVPIQPWDGVTGSGGNTGYCPHDSNLFGPWHRPYMALYEQRIVYYAKKIANEFPAGKKRTNNVAAAETLRIPYWDWAANISPVLPTAVSSQTIQVTRPNGNKATITNPLYSYHFNPLSASDMGNFRPFSIWDETKREPSGTDANAQSNNAAVASNLESQASSYRSRVYNLMIGKGTYNLVTNHGSGSTGDTFEGIHDGIHAIFGSNSHMLYLSYSAHE
jgi:tyrosinase